MVQEMKVGLPRAALSSDIFTCSFQFFTSLKIQMGCGCCLQPGSMESCPGQAGISLLPAARGSQHQLLGTSLPQSRWEELLFPPGLSNAENPPSPFPYPTSLQKDNVACENDEDNKMCCSIILDRSCSHSSPRAQPPVCHRLTQRAFRALPRRLGTGGRWKEAAFI